MISYSTFEAKTRLSELLALVALGVEIEITRHRRPVARLVPVPAKPDAAAPNK